MAGLIGRILPRQFAPLGPRAQNPEHAVPCRRVLRISFASLVAEGETTEGIRRLYPDLEADSVDEALVDNVLSAADDRVIVFADTDVGYAAGCAFCVERLRSSSFASLAVASPTL